MYWGLVHRPQKEEVSTLALLKTHSTHSAPPFSPCNLFLSPGLEVVSGWKGSVLYPSNSYVPLLQVGLGFRQRLGGWQEEEGRPCQRSEPPPEPAGEGGQAAVGEGGDCPAGRGTEGVAQGAGLPGPALAPGCPRSRSWSCLAPYRPVVSATLSHLSALSISLPLFLSLPQFLSLLLHLGPYHLCLLACICASHCTCHAGCSGNGELMSKCDSSSVSVCFLFLSVSASLFP